MYRAKIINLIGAPGVGKSTFAARLFADMKIKNLNVELCSEFIKDKIWEESKMVLSNQLYIFASQYFKQCCVADKADFVISDGALITEPLYNNYPEPMRSHLNLLVTDIETQFDNLYYLISHPVNHVNGYQDFGRLHSYEESQEKEKILLDFLNSENIPFKTITNSELGIALILRDLL